MKKFFVLHKSIVLPGCRIMEIGLIFVAGLLVGFMILMLVYFGFFEYMYQNAFEI